MTRRIFIIVLILLISLPIIACEPLASLKVENRTNQALTIYAAYSDYEHVPSGYERVLLGSVEPGKTLEPEFFPGVANSYLFEAKDPTGNTVFLKEFTRQQLVSSKWKVVIS